MKDKLQRFAANAIVVTVAIVTVCQAESEPPRPDVRSGGMTCEWISRCLPAVTAEVLELT
jgi:hypothetical protein